MKYLKLFDDHNSWIDSEGNTWSDNSIHLKKAIEIYLEDLDFNNKNPSVSLINASKESIHRPAYKISYSDKISTRGIKSEENFVEGIFNKFCRKYDMELIVCVVEDNQAFNCLDVSIYLRETLLTKYPL